MMHCNLLHSNIYLAILSFIQRIFAEYINRVYTWRRDKLYLNSCSKSGIFLGEYKRRGEPERLLLGLGLPPGLEVKGKGGVRAWPCTGDEKG